MQAVKPKKTVLQRYIASRVAEAVNLDANKIDLSSDVRSYGMDSMRQMQLLRELEDRLGCSLPTTMFDEFTTIEQIVDTLLSDAYTKISPKIAEFIDQEINSFKVR